MSKNECPLCFKKFNNQENKPYIMTCGDTICLKCIDHYKEALQSTGIFNKAIDLNDNSNENQNTEDSDNKDGFFELLIRNKTSQEKISIKVKKEYTIGEVKNILYKEKNIPIQSYHLAFRKPLNDENTLESYGIIKTVTITQISDLVGGI